LLAASTSIVSVARAADGGGAAALPPALQGFGSDGFNAAGRDLTVKPGDDFFRYANGTYIKDLIIPPDQTSYGPFSILAERSRDQVRTLLNDVSAHPVADPKTTEQKLGVYYASFLDQARVDQLGAKPLAGDLDAIKGVNDLEAFAKLTGMAASGFQSSPFDIGINPDDHDPTKFSIDVAQSGLGLPDRDYYLKPDFAAKRQAYRDYIVTMLGLIGYADAAKNADAIVALETGIAKVHWALEAERDPVKAYNPMTVAQLAKAAPGFDWQAWLVAAGIPATGLEKRVLIIGQPSAIAGEAKLLAGADPAVLRAWMAFHLADNAAPYLSRAFTDASFAFNGKTLNGQPAQSERWKRGVRVTSSAMGWAIGKSYAARYFPPSSKARITELVGEVKAAFKYRLEHNEWMEPQTRAAAGRKIDNFDIQVGYPKSWRDYSKLTVKQGDVYGNASRSLAFNWNFWLNHLDQKVDREVWFDMMPQTVNAENIPNYVEVVFPAAILQPPFFNPNADPAINYGAIGGVIGHEMTHSFDDQGRQYDEHGRLHDWWTKKDAQKFQALADRFGKQYDAFEIFPGVHVNGKLTMGENIADLGGLTLGLEAYHASLHGKPAPVVDGMTGDQRVFLGWAQVWREKLRDAHARNLIVTDPHSPPRARVNIPSHNIDAWYKAFDVQPGQKLYIAPAQRVKIW